MTIRLTHTLAFTVCLLLGVSSADAQVSCFVGGGFVIPVRTEGIAELMGDVGLFCQASGPLTDLVTADIRVSLNTSVTNNRDFGKGIDIADAILTVNGNDCPLGVSGPQTTSTGFGQGTNPSPFTPLPQYGQLTSDATLP